MTEFVKPARYVFLYVNAREICLENFRTFLIEDESTVGRCSNLEGTSQRKRRSREAISANKVSYWKHNIRIITADRAAEEIQNAGFAFSVVTWPGFAAGCERITIGSNSNFNFRILLVYLLSVPVSFETRLFRFFRDIDPERIKFNKLFLTFELNGQQYYLGYLIISRDMKIS